MPRAAIVDKSNNRTAHARSRGLKRETAASIREANNSGDRSRRPAVVEMHSRGVSAHPLRTASDPTTIFRVVRPVAG